MSEFDDKLNAILSSPDTMNQIMSIANSLSAGSSTPPPSENQAPPPPAVPTQGAAPALNLGGLASLLGGGDSPLSGLDPGMLEKAMELFQEYQREDDEKAALLTAIRPFLREERGAKIDRVIQVTKLSRVIKLAMKLFRKEAPGPDV